MRVAHHGLRMNDEIGFQCDKTQGECRSKFACHLDRFAWVKRDSYLPQGSHDLKELIENLDRDLLYAIRVEGKMDVESVSNYDEMKNAIMEKLIMLRDESKREDCPLIYHLDVAAMFPNIILTNRLQVKH
ncbi:DNA polymerase epsilon catalytic subunit A-like protein [Tanacetum coccineum]